jgi:hypothetical protein
MNNNATECPSLFEEKDDRVLEEKDDRVQVGGYLYAVHNTAFPSFVKIGFRKQRPSFTMGASKCGMND